MKSWYVDYEDGVESKLIKDFQSGLLTRDDLLVLKKWVRDVEAYGLYKAQVNPTWRDHGLTRGKWRGYRAISISYSGRVIYREESEKRVVIVARVSTNHDYT